MEVKQITAAPTCKSICKDCHDGRYARLAMTTPMRCIDVRRQQTVGRGLAPADFYVFAFYKAVIACKDTTHPPAEPVPLPFIKGRLTDCDSRPLPPLCKGRWHGVCRDGGIVSQRHTKDNPSVSRKG
ncbi:MAG: hypothetical protein PUC29_08155 [Clostridia bacterium]|nr:hypothetical protein [Clostridia bacterium]